MGEQCMQAVFHYLSRLNLRIIAFAGAGSTQCASGLQHFALEINTFAAFVTDNARSFETREVFRLYIDFDPFPVEQNVIGELGVGFLLTRILFHFGEHFARGLLRRFLRGDAQRAACFQIDERSRDLSPVAHIQRAFAEAAIRYQRDRIGEAAIDFHVRDDAFALGDRIVDAEVTQAQRGHAHAKYLAGTKMAVRGLGEFQIFIQRFHNTFYFCAIYFWGIAR